MALTDNLISYWKLNEASGNALDAHGTNTLTDTNALGTGTGKIGNARDFEASGSQYLSIADNASLSTGNVDFTIQAWVNIESFDRRMVVAKDDEASGSREYLIALVNPGIDFRFTASVFLPTDAEVGVFANNFGTPSLGTWYLIHFWHDAAADQIGISVNAGSPDTASTGGSLQASGVATFRIGSREYSGFLDPWDGLIDEVGFWKRVLTSQERTDLYNGGAGLSYDAFGGADVVVTPGVVALTTTKFAPTVSVPRNVIPATRSLTLSSFTPVVTTPRLVVPSKPSLTLTAFAPAVTVPRLVVPAKPELTLATFAPAVRTPVNSVPATRNLITSSFAPTAQTGSIVTPGTNELSLAFFAPTVTLPQRPTPGTLSVFLTRFTPVVVAAGDSTLVRTIVAEGWKRPAVSLVGWKRPVNIVVQPWKRDLE